MAKGRPTRLRLFDILNAIHGVESMLQGKTLEDYQASHVLQLAVERSLEIISEAARYVPEEMRARATQIPWTTIELFGNKARHEYQSMSARRVWRVAIEDLAPLKVVIREFYSEVKRPTDPWPDAKHPDQG